VLPATHDRRIIHMEKEHIVAWLNPDATNLDAMHALLENWARP
jgi:hypothetical protein